MTSKLLDFPCVHARPGLVVTRSSFKTAFENYWYGLQTTFQETRCWSQRFEVRPLLENKRHYIYYWYLVTITYVLLIAMANAFVVQSHITRLNITFLFMLPRYNKDELYMDHCNKPLYSGCSSVHILSVWLCAQNPWEWSLQGVQKKVDLFKFKLGITYRVSPKTPKLLKSPIVRIWMP